MKKTVIIPEEIRNKIQALQYEVESRKDLLTYMAANGTDIHSEAFTSYHQDYQDFYVQYQAAKDELQNTILAPTVPGKLNHWDLDFASCKVVCVYDKD